MGRFEVDLWVEEIAFSGSIAVKESESTLYRRARAMNKYLEENNYDWRVKANKETMSIDVVYE